MNFKAITRNVGYALLVSALFMFLSILVSVFNGNDSALAALLISFTITFLVGIFPFIFVRKTSAISLKDGYCIIVLSWLLSFIFGMLPYALWGGPFTVMNAWFESVSGFTTTGSTILEDIEALPKSLLFWRSSTHFIGGLGVVVFLLLIIPSASPIRMRLTNMELSSLSKDAYKVRANKTVYIFAVVYIVICVVAFFSYWIAGMTPFDAINHAMSICATGGFSTRNRSIGAYDSRLIEGLSMLFMYVGSLHFGILYMTFAKRSLRPLNNPVLKFYTAAVFVFSIGLGITLKVNGISPSFGRALWDGTFSVLSIASTTGFATVDNASWPIQASIISMFLGVMCACAGSTTGGIKADRVLVLLKAVGRQVKQILHPNSVNEIKVGKNILRDEEVNPQLLYITLYGLLLLLSVVLCLMLGVSSHNAFAATISSLGNVGPAVEELGSMGNFNGIPSMAKFVYSMDMFLGRIEIYPVLAVCAMVFAGKKK